MFRVVFRNGSVLLAIMICIVILGACSKNKKDEPVTSEASILGKWRATHLVPDDNDNHQPDDIKYDFDERIIIMTYKGDGTGTQYYKDSFGLGNEIAFKWSLSADNKKLTITPDSANYSQVENIYALTLGEYITEYFDSTFAYRSFWVYKKTMIVHSTK